jgi:hypothetical protein
LSRNRDRDRERRNTGGSSRPTVLDEARNELFSHIHRCGVLQATEEQQVEWLTDTIDFLHERYPSLTEADRKNLSDIGLRFCRPVIANHTPAADETSGTADEAELDAGDAPSDEGEDEDADTIVAEEEEEAVAEATAA